MSVWNVWGLVVGAALLGDVASSDFAKPVELQGDFALWDDSVPLPSPESLHYPQATRDVLVHRADDEYKFLHDNAVVWHENTLFAGWYNCPTHEMVEASSIRARRSLDEGRTWSAVETIAQDSAHQGVLYVPMVFLSRQGVLHAFIANMVGPDLVTRCEAFRLNETEARWVSDGFVAGPFLPNCPPILMEDGRYIMAGRFSAVPAAKPETPAVALSQGGDLTSPWTIVPLMRGHSKPYTDYPESTVWVDGSMVTALVRGRLAFTSRDYGRTWDGPYRHNLPSEDSKPFALQLSTGQRCFLWNYPAKDGAYRHLLTLAVSRPGETKLSMMWKLRDGYCDTLQAGPEWSYPCAVEHDGALYVIYTSEKKHSVMTVVPLRSLQEAVVSP